MTHEIKLLAAFADAVLSGEKTFEVRYNDRGYQKGDLIKFKVVDNCFLLGIPHPLNDKQYEITYIIRGCNWGLKDGYVVFSIREVGGNE